MENEELYSAPYVVSACSLLGVPRNVAENGSSAAWSGLSYLALYTGLSHLHKKNAVNDKF
jgi:hypothetical protein